MTQAEGAEPAPLRIGTAERDSAMKALDAHLEAGRLTVDEYADRSAVAANATMAGELTGLFTDLPAPHPQLAGAVAVSAQRPVAAPAAGDGAGDGTVATAGTGFLDSWGGRIMAAAPFVAVGLFFLLHTWVVFLLIPLAGALLYGDRNHGRDRQDRRDERRDRR